MERSWRGAESWLWVAVLLAVATLIHCLAPAIVDQDTSYHIAVARLMREHGMLQAFPWTRFSWLADHYVDKELIFHALMMPLSGMEPLVCARVVGSALGFALLLTVFLILQKEGVAQPGLWVLLGLLCSGAFILRFAMVRPHLLSISLALGVVWLAARERRLGLGMLALLYPFCYTAWHLPIALIVLVEGSRWVCERRVAWSPLAVALAGLCAGIALHPHFPRNLEFFWIQNFDVLLGVAWAGKAGFEMGPEFGSYSAADTGRLLLLPLLMMGAAAHRTWLLWRRGQRDVLPVAFVAIAIALAVLTARSSRFLEYFVPFTVVAAALSVRALRLPRLLPAAVVVAGAFLGVFGRGPLHILTHRGEDFPAADMAALRNAIPPQSQVVTCDWGLTGGLMLALPDRKFVVALDPVFFWRQDPELYRFWFQAVHQPTEHPAQAFRQKMAADFIVCDARGLWRPLVGALQRDPGARVSSITPFWISFDLRGGAGGAYNDLTKSTNARRSELLSLPKALAASLPWPS